MKSKFLEFEADSLKEARKKANAEKPAGLYLVSEEIISDGKRKTAKGGANSEEAAFEKARNEVPPGSEILDEKVLVPPSHRTLYVKAFNKAKALTKVKRQVGENQRIVVRLKTSGEKVFLGLVKRSDIYEAKVFQPPVVEVAFKSKPKIRVEISDINVPSMGYCQMCGKSNTPRNISKDKEVVFFCSSACNERYDSAYLFSSIGTVFGMDSGGGEVIEEIESGKKMAKSLTVHCWSCGISIPMGTEKCTSCRKKQKIEL